MTAVMIQAIEKCSGDDKRTLFLAVMIPFEITLL